MTPQEKAKELVLKFRNKILEGLVFTDEFNPEREKRHMERAKQCALIAVGELIQEEYSHFDSAMFESGAKGYWQKVKEELEEL